MNTHWILVIDGDEESRCQVHDALQCAGYGIIEAGNGRQGLALFHSVHPEIVLADFDPADDNAGEVVTELRRTAPGTEVILMANSVTALGSVAMAGRATRVLPKPLGHRVVVEAVEQALQHAGRGTTPAKDLPHQLTDAGVF
jgi:DNA-binding NtrC family response regulator